MTESERQLLEEIREKLQNDCARGWDEHTNHFIVPKGSRTWEEEMERGDSWAWELIQKIDAILSQED